MPRPSAKMATLAAFLKMDWKDGRGFLTQRRGGAEVDGAKDVGVKNKGQSLVLVDFASLFAIDCFL
jgi:hypothetical protein